MKSCHAGFERMPASNIIHFPHLQNHNIYSLNTWLNNHFMNTPKLYVGTAGWSYKDWVPSFYPCAQSKELSWLTVNQY